ncbi:UEV-domain-containing protein [Plenodomus tracheiphilus IPT5]|uniref:UEV-domain-containing protein n=1 Tax=Plenodomus tracheiphilus IPT5 TaxID=1408161 RepID=A0A6A7ARE0_9PLEO|nr:UEV-domain-containing protein [Plenodomus tracheiphilus IPT5]
MSAVPDKVLNWLYSVLTSEYAHVQRTYSDAAEVLSSYPSLTTRTEIYTYENGASALLLLLSGTLPVTFRGATYGFPVAIWVPYAYPHEPPIVYITPSPDMVVRPGQHVSGDGRVYHPYLAQWAQYWDKSTLFDFLAVLRGVFAKEPPVRSKQQQQQQQYNTPPAQAPPPIHPPPAEWRRSTHGHEGASLSPGPSSQPPAPPPKPPKPGDQNRQTPQPQRDRYSQPPPLPAHPPQHPQPQAQLQPQYQSQRNGHGMPHSWQQPQPQGYATPSRQGSHDISPLSQSGQQAPHAQQYQALPPPRSQQFMGLHQAQQHYPPQPVQGYPPQAHPQYQQQQQQHRPRQQTPSAANPPIDLLDDSLQVTLPSQSNNHIPLPVPPVPPNPEKDALLRALSQALVSQIRQTVSSNHSAVGPLQAQQDALQTAHTRLQAELGELQQMDTALASNEQVLKGAMVEADRVMEDARRRKVPDVDDVLVAPTLVGGQLYSLAAEEKGIADAIFVLGRALDKGRVGAEVFVKQTRSLAREQFLKKAHIKKIAQGMALDEYQMR